MFKPDSPLINTLGKASDFVILNVLALILSIPIFTFGAVKTSLLYGIDKIIKDEEGAVVATFFLQFKEEFKRSSAIWLMYLFVAGVTLFDSRIMLKSNIGMVGSVLTAVFLVLFVVETMVCFGGLAWSARFNDNIKTTIKNAFLVSLLNLPLMLIVVVLEVAPWVIISVIDYSIGNVFLFYGFIGISLTTAAETLLFRKVYKPLLEKFEGESETKPNDDEWKVDDKEE